MKHCPKCNLDFPDTYRFCGSCGGSLSDSLRCPACGELTEGKWTFCTNCGKPVSANNASNQASSRKTPEAADTSALPDLSPTPRIPPPPTLTMPAADPPATNQQRSEKLTPQEWYAATDLYDEETTTTAPAPVPRQEKVLETIAPAPQASAPAQANAERSAPSLTMLSGYGEPEAPSQFHWWHGAILGLFVLLVVGGLGLGAWYWWSHRGSVAQITPPAESNNSPLPESYVTSPSPSSTTTATSDQKLKTNSADEEIKLLRERRTAAKPSESRELIAAFQSAEKKYPADYRFPYERAKISIAGVTAHHEAFGALALAAEKAIDNGKAQEMLDNLTADENGDFHKLSRGHREWQALMQALSNKDRRGLSELHH